MTVTFSTYLETISWLSTASQAIGDVILMDGAVGISQGTPTASGQNFPVRIRGICIGLVKDTLVAVAIGQLAYYDSVNSVFTTRPTAYRAGIFMAAQLITDAVCTVQLEPYGVGPVMAAIEAPVTIGGAAFASEAVVATLSLPANLPLYSRIRVKAKFRATGENSTDTLALHIRLTGVSGTILAYLAAVQMAATTQATLDFEGVITVIGSTGEIDGTSTSSAVAGTAVSSYAVHATSVALNAALAVVVTALYSSSSATNAGQLYDFALIRDG